MGAVAGFVARIAPHIGLPHAAVGAGDVDLASRGHRSTSRRAAGVSLGGARRGCPGYEPRRVDHQSALGRRQCQRFTTMEMIRKMVRIAEELGRPIATPEQTREILELGAWYNTAEKALCNHLRGLPNLRRRRQSAAAAAAGPAIRDILQLRYRRRESVVAQRISAWSALFGYRSLPAVCFRLLRRPASEFW
ncbi:3-keto-5-aminohexanoate cleavage protein [Nocardia sp. NPDC101769]|uniref:3-keto-5-aminohexanoate cleavage protein n=1 Tax=Nocardia sp. NPDC101769 TaxID=3364333 RepID=UPI003818B796